MKQQRVWAESPVIQEATWLLEQDILVIFETKTHKNPYLTIKGDPESKFPPIILGNTSGSHYQSYTPEKDNDFKELLKRDNTDNVKATTSSSPITSTPLRSAPVVTSDNHDNPGNVKATSSTSPTSTPLKSSHVITSDN